jgi:alcohol dehydrogenase
MNMISQFDFQPTSRVIFGRNSLSNIKDYIQDFDCKHALVVTDMGIVEAGLLDKLLHYLHGSSLNVHVFQECEPNPTTDHVNRGVDFARDKGIDLIIALGGGSSMDCAKGINFILTNGGQMEDYWGRDKATQPMLTSIGIPTTAGTGSEAQSYALISQKSTRRKMACGDIKARFKLVILDPELVLSVPKNTAVVTGIDSLSHAIESYVSTAANPVSQMFAREAWKLLDENFERVLDGTANVDTWGQMLLGAHFAGHSIENSMLGAAHAMANPITAKKNIDHGIAVGLVLPYVIEYNSKKSTDLYNGFISGKSFSGNGHHTPDILINQIDRYFELAHIPKNLKHYGIAENELDILASEAMENWTAKFNPRPLEKEDFLTLYKNAL